MDEFPIVSVYKMIILCGLLKILGIFEFKEEMHWDINGELHKSKPKI